MATKTLTFHLTPDEVAERQKSAASAGFQLKMPSGEAEARGCRIGYSYDAESETLTITILHTPPFCGGMAESAINNWFKEN